MTVRKAQNRVRKQYGIGKTKLHKRMRRRRDELVTLADKAQYPHWITGAFDAETKQRMHDLVDQLGADSVIATAYREAEEAARREEA